MNTIAGTILLYWCLASLSTVGCCYTNARTRGPQLLVQVPCCGPPNSESKRGKNLGCLEDFFEMAAATAVVHSRLWSRVVRAAIFEGTVHLYHRFDTMVEGDYCVQFESS